MHEALPLQRANRYRALLRKLRPMVEDAERYRWLRSRARAESREGGWLEMFILPYVQRRDSTPYQHEHGGCYDYETLDAAIDAARAKGE